MLFKPINGVVPKKIGKIPKILVIVRFDCAESKIESLEKYVNVSIENKCCLIRIGVVLKSFQINSSREKYSHTIGIDYTEYKCQLNRNGIV